MTDFNPRVGAVERFQEVKDYSENADGAQNEKEVRLLTDTNNSGGISLVEAIGIRLWLEQVIEPALVRGKTRLALLGYEGESADVRAFLGPDNCLSISLSGVRFADVGTAILNEQGDELFLISDDLVGTEVVVSCEGYGSMPQEVSLGEESHESFCGCKPNDGNYDPIGLGPRATADDEVPIEEMGENMGGAVLRRFGLVSDR